MAVVAPFKGMTYDFEKTGDISKLITPPYDVISEDEQKEYYNSDPHNVIRLILGKNKTGDSDWDNRYTRAAEYLERWKSDGVIRRSDLPAMYLTSHEYVPGDGSGPRVRWGIVALVRIEDEGSGVILPHEKTFSAHKNDRLKLMRACSSQLSQIFGLYDDSENRISGYIKKAASDQPSVSFEYRDGTKHGMWEITDQALFKRFADVMSEKSIFIADGHHRYETARNFRDIMRSRHSRSSVNRAYEYVMMYLTDMNDAGLTILPSHRLIKKCDEFQLETFFERLRPCFDISELPVSSSDYQDQSDSIRQILKEKGRESTSMIFHYHKGSSLYLLSLRPGAEKEMGDGLHPSLKQLDVVVLSRLVFERGLGFLDEDLDNDRIFHYSSDMEYVLSKVDAGDYAMAFLLNPTKMDHVKMVASNSQIMPRKSTYFYPKVLTGLVFNKIDPNENIRTF